MSVSHVLFQDLSTLSTVQAPVMSRDRPQSVVIAGTHSGAVAFGEDIADDQYSVSELSHVEDESRARRVKGHAGLGAAGTKEIFLRTTLSRAPPGLERMVSPAAYCQRSQLIISIR